MKKETYEKIISFFEASAIRRACLKALCCLTPFFCAAVYIFTGVLLIFAGDKRVFMYAAVPAAGFVFVTVFRKIADRKRPYEALGFKPFLSYKDGKGQSFPSRHTASAFLIASACFYINPWLGSAMTAVAVAVGVSRFLSGMHYPSDIISAIFISVLIAVLGYYVL